MQLWENGGQQASYTWPGELIRAERGEVRWTFGL